MGKKLKYTHEQWVARIHKDLMRGNPRTQVVLEVARRPNVVVCIQGFYNNTFLGGYGFSKVCHPDKFTKSQGVFIAMNKAIGDLAELLVEEFGEPKPVTSGSATTGDEIEAWENKGAVAVPPAVDVDELIKTLSLEKEI